MCILCVLQEVSVKARTVLPWLVIFLSVFWAISQLLPRPFRIDMSIARVTCFFFLLAVVLWQRILRPQLLLWQTLRATRLRERRWNEAVELQKLRKIAIRRCRNCLNPYRDQNPAAGKFMCVYCGHVSKRPVLDIPGVRSEGTSLNCTHDWSPEVRYWNGAGGRNEISIPGMSYSGTVVVTRRLVYGVFLTFRWVFRKVFGVGSSSREADELSDGESKGMSKKGRDQESKVDKLKRKAEEKRQARLEKEMLEEEERKQREDVARLVEERRKLRDEKLVGETEDIVENKENSKSSEKVVVVVKKESEKKRRDRRRDKDKCSSKSNSDGEDLERKYVNMNNNREGDRKKDFDKKSESEKREFQKACIENIRNQMLEGTVGVKTNLNNRMAGSFSSSSRGFSGSNFFGKGSSTTSPAVAVNKSNKYTTSNTVDRRDNSVSSTSQQQLGGSISPPPPTNVWKKSWQQLFTCSSSSSLSSSSSSIYSSGSANITCNNNTQLNDHQALSSFPPLNHVNLVKSTQTNNSHGSISDEMEHFEDPSYVPDPISLLGPVSESLDNFPVDLGSGFVTNAKIDNPHVQRSTVSTVSDAKPSPIESPVSRLRFSREKPSPIGQFCGSPKARDSQTLRSEGLNHSNELGTTWKMWGNSLGGLDPLGIVGGPVNRLLPIGPSKSNHDSNHPYSGSNNYSANYQKDGLFTPLGSSGFNEDVMWLKKNCIGDTGEENPVLKDTPNISVGGHSCSSGFNEDVMWLKKNCIGDTGEENPVLKDTPNISVGGHSFEKFPSDCWSKSDWVGISSSEDVGNADTSSRTNHGGLFSSDPDIQSVWSFK